jgi:hypothetical protein
MEEVVSSNLTRSTKTFQRLTTFNGSFTICNTSDPSTCDDIPEYTSWNLGICFGPLPTKFLNAILKHTGPIPFSSAITGSGFEAFTGSLTGNSLAPLPTD